MPLFIPLIILFVAIVPGSIPTFFIITFIYGFIGKEMALPDKVKKISGHSFGSKTRIKFNKFFGSKQ